MQIQVIKLLPTTILVLILFFGKTITREETLARFLTARQHKREVVADLGKTMKAEYEKETGKKAN